MKGIDPLWKEIRVNTYLEKEHEPNESRLNSNGLIIKDQQFLLISFKQDRLI